VEAPGDGDGGLVAVTSESLRCLSCPHAATCRHLHAAGRSSGQDTRRSHHTAADMQDYLKLVHDSISEDGRHMKLKGRSRHKIAWTAVRAAWGVGSMCARARAVHQPLPILDEDIDIRVRPLEQCSLLHPPNSAVEASSAGGAPTLASVLTTADQENPPDSSAGTATDPAADIIARRFRSVPPVHHIAHLSLWMGPGSLR